MQFIKFYLFFILSLLISINIYSDNLFDGSKSDINNHQANYANNLENNNKAIAPAIPFIVEGVKDALIATGTALGTSTLLKGDTKKPCTPCNPPVKEKFDIEIDTNHDHGNCLYKTGSMTHWHYYEMNQNPQYL